MTKSDSTKGTTPGQTKQQPTTGGRTGETNRGTGTDKTQGSHKSEKDTTDTSKKW